jgi:hypothetical protein
VRPLLVRRSRHAPASGNPAFDCARVVRPGGRCVRHTFDGLRIKRA